MPATISLTERQTLSALRTVLRGILPSGTPVIRGEVNRVPEPRENDFVVYWPILRTRLSTNVTTFDDEPLHAPPIGLRNDLGPTQVTVQCDVHGPNSPDNAQMIATLIRSEYGCQAFTATGYDVQPLYADDPRQSPFDNAEQQLEWRWSVDVVLQANPVVSTPQDFADQAHVTTFEADIPGPLPIAIYQADEWDEGSVYGP